MSLSIFSTAMMAPPSYFLFEIAHRSRHQVVFPKTAPFAGQTRTRVKSGCSVVVHSSVDPKPLLPSDRSDPWRMRFLGVMMSTILSFFRSKWGQLMKTKNEVETTVDTVDQVTETVETVAEEVDKIAEEVNVVLPKGGKLREAVTAVDMVAKTTVKDAQLIEDIINKVEEVEKDVDSFMDQKPPSDAAKGA